MWFYFFKKWIKTEPHWGCLNDRNEFFKIVAKDNIAKEEQMLFSMNYSIFLTKGKTTRHSKKFAVRGRDDIHYENTGQQIPLRTILGTSLIVTDKAIRVKLNLLFAQFTVLGRGGGRETSQEFLCLQKVMICLALKRWEASDVHAVFIKFHLFLLKYQYNDLELGQC